MAFENIKLDDIKVLSDEEFEESYQEDERSEDTPEPEATPEIEEPEVPEPEPEKANPEVEEPEAPTPEPEKEAKKTEEQPDFDSIIDERSEGRFKSWEELSGQLSEAEELKQKLQEYEDLGIDDFAKDMLKYRKENGDFTPYLEAKSVDYDSMDGRDVYLKHLKQENPELSTEEVNDLLYLEYDKKMQANEDIEMLDDDEARELRASRASMKSKINQYRKSFKETQAKFKSPEKQDDSKQQTEAAEKQREAELNYMLEHPGVAKLKKDGKITFEVGEDKDSAFNVEVDAKEVEQLIKNPMAFFNDFVTKDEKGNPKTNKEGVLEWNMGELAKVFALRNKIPKLVQDAISHGKSLSKEELEKELENPPVQKNQQAPRRSKSLGEAAVAAGIKL